MASEPARRAPALLVEARRLVAVEVEALPVGRVLLPAGQRCCTGYKPVPCTAGSQLAQPCARRPCGARVPACSLPQMALCIHSRTQARSFEDCGAPAVLGAAARSAASAASASRRTSSQAKSRAWYSRAAGARPPTHRAMGGAGRRPSPAAAAADSGAPGHADPAPGCAGHAPSAPPPAPASAAAGSGAASPADLAAGCARRVPPAAHAAGPSGARRAAGAPTAAACGVSERRAPSGPAAVWSGGPPGGAAGQGIGPGARAATGPDARAGGGPRGPARRLLEAPPQGGRLGGHLGARAHAPLGVQVQPLARPAGGRMLQAQRPAPRHIGDLPEQAGSLAEKQAGSDKLGVAAAAPPALRPRRRSLPHPGALSSLLTRKRQPHLAKLTRPAWYAELPMRCAS